MTSKQELQVQQKRELEKKEETTVPARIFVPAADIYETPDALKVVLEMPGVDKSNVNVRVENGVLTVEGRLDFSKYRDLQPLYTEYNIGHYARSFRLTTKNRSKQDRSRNERRRSLSCASESGGGQVSQHSSELT